MTSATYVATPPQRALFTEYQLHPGDNAFDLTFLFRLDGIVDARRLARAISFSIASSPGLHTTFGRGGDVVLATVGDPCPDVARLPLPDHMDAEGWALDYVARDGHRRLEPNEPSQIRVRIFDGGEVTYLYVRASHLVADAYSFYILAEAWASLYATPEDQWESITESSYLHPGNVERPGVSQRALAAYATRLQGLTRVTHDVLTTQRIDGRIQGRNYFVQLSGDAARQLRDSWAVQANGLASTFFAAYAAVLQRIEGRPEIVVGVPLGNRPGHQAKRALGYFVNTLPLPVRIDHTTKWGELCESVRSGVRTLQACQGLDPTGPASRGLFPPTGWAPDNAVTIYKQSLVLTLPGVRTTSIPLRRPSLTYPFTVNVADLGDDFDIEVCAHDGLRDVPIEGLLLEALEQLSAGPDNLVIVDRLTALGESEARGLHDRTTLTELVEQACDKHGPRVAVTDSTEALTYTQLWSRGEALANWLDEHDATPYVLVKGPKCADTVASILGILISGRAYVPLDPDGAPGRELLIRQRVGSAQGCPATEVGGAAATTGPSPVISPRSSAGPLNAEQPAYVIFTSGSTGEPKGVVIPHGNVTDLLRSTVDRFGLGSSDTWCLFHSLAFDFSVWELFGALTTGARLDIPAAHVVRDPAATAAWLNERAVTVLNQTPSAFRRLSALLGDGSVLGHVRLLIFGGEALYPSDLASWWQVVGRRAMVVNMYGITETTVHVTAKEMSPDVIDAKTSLIGDPLPHLDLVVLDPDGRECPPGLVGEIYVSGSGVASGYLDLPELTRDRFVPLRRGGAYVTAYRTGDLARRGGDGELVYCGRRDHQVQLRGYRIELGEVESALLRLPGVEQVVVSMEAPQGAEPFLAAWIQGADPRENAGALQEALPSYMHPSRWTPVRSIPTNQSGKPDLIELRRLAAQHTRQLVPALDEESWELTLRIAQVWEGVIQTGRVGPDDHFLQIGGSSMHVMAIHEVLCAEQGIPQFDVVDLYEFPTPLLLARHLLELAPVSIHATKVNAYDD